MSQKMNSAQAASKAPIKAEIVNCVIEPVINVIKSYVGEEPDIANIAVTTQIDPPPWLGVTIDLCGNVVGPITCVVSEGLARLIARKMTLSEDVDPVICYEAVSELANIITGNATGKLVDAGYNVEIMPPRAVPDDRHLTRRTLVITLSTAAGTIKMLLGLRTHEPNGAVTNI
jgi:CheY-specific phosphatase CheX